MENPEILHTLKWRYAVKEFDKEKKIKEEDWDVIEETLQYSPSSYGLQPWKFIIITDEEIRKKLIPFTLNPTQLNTCSHLVVFCALNIMDKPYIENWIQLVSKTRNIPLESLQAYKNMMIKGVEERNPEQNFAWHKAQVYLSLGFTLHTAASMKIDACPIEGINSKGYNEVLELEKENYSAVVMAAFGYRSENDIYSKLPKVRFPKEKVIFKL